MNDSEIFAKGWLEETLNRASLESKAHRKIETMTDDELKRFVSEKPERGI